MIHNLEANLSFLLGFVEARDWSAFEWFALSNPDMYKCISNAICECAEVFNGMTLLHACVRYDPPVSLLLKMIELHPEAIRRVDCIGRTPLHVAAGSGVSPLVVQVLTKAYPQACNIQDNDGRTPLHFACDSSCELFEANEENSSRGPPCLDTIRVILSGSLDAVTLEDSDEMNALEYALLSDAPIELITFLQRTMQRVIRMKQKQMKSSPSNMTKPLRSCSTTATSQRIRVPL
ncbi:hypothetical protein ACHAXA_008841 [Cyclostephanos tholiformis]|uniref:Uncharacterized protein n=1 Tax=Cyclostephanos tholiformis TaxID=382380 RepID=A0ABD3SFZ6_9STRA